MPTFLLEIGTEELPATFVSEAISQWEKLIPTALSEAFLTNDGIKIYATPRRLAVVINNLPTQQPDREEEIKGPPAKAAFKDGKPTKAAEGFAKKQEIELKDLEIRPTEKGDFVFVNKKIKGKQTAEILIKLVPEWINKLEGKRFMRWADGDIKFPRPIRWLVTLLDGEILPINLENGSEIITSDRISYGHRVLHPESIEIEQAKDYAEVLKKAYIEVDFQQRKSQVEQQIQTVAKKVQGTAEVPTELLAEVTNLVEWPTAVVGKIDEEFLILPSEVTTTVMVTHQRYFPVLKSTKTAKAKVELLPYFITISNGDPEKSEIIAKGNERVIRARLADGQFFYKADLAKPLESYLPELEAVTFQAKLGSVRKKVERIINIAKLIAEQLKVSQEESKNIERSALLCKADLVTQMVYEFPELQGIMGEKYARACGENEAVATAIFEHYLPRGAGDILPESISGQVVSLADKLDTLVSIFGLGMLPTGSSDPFALRRAANAVVNITWSAELPINLHQLLAQISVDFTKFYPEAESELLPQLYDFFLQRIKTILQEEKNIDYDLVNAVLGNNDSEYTERALKDLLDVRNRAVFLQSIRQNSLLDQIYETVNRSTRLATQGELDKIQLAPKKNVDLNLFKSESELAFYNALVDLVPQTKISQKTRNYQQLVDGLAKIAPTVSNFFDGPESVLVMDPDPKIKQNRLNLLGLLRNNARVLADFGEIVKS
ncbi:MULTISPECIES: glycine--tRNA ligase subunit beta [Okeania]|uniref:glycine--tRNA ligase subunit beta n=1 Tax=Okeania TaxID=1458928 RepID=UPI000F5460ED|nr:MULTISPECIES: glycine--tRNA ligase subunit beta [Okeania]NES75584.1 glycine--tRNA ligase subunit beta [Okeania sp. SIO1H4]NET18013.1 glycine--tRNA ligase subunit beta [Okeania sp. SIO1H5]NET93015.1 glycine--tRNA ligase subunit beta [Okeania sp. SIO1H2]RQH11095.1 glycine--tRNA ligase subunit beta [Okeania hirsuta]